MKGWNKIAKYDRENQKIRADKKALRVAERVKTWQLAIVLVIFIILTAMFLRLNNLEMMNRRDALIAADKTGDINQVEAASVELQNFVSGHMNTSTGKIPLQSLYSQAAQEAISKSKPTQINSELYNAAQAGCMPQLHNYGYESWARCVADSVGLSDTDSLTQDNVVAPNPDVYYVEYASVRWSVDPAGILLLTSFLLVLFMAFRILFVIILQITLLIRSQKLRKI